MASRSATSSARCRPRFATERMGYECAPAAQQTPQYLPLKGGGRLPPTSSGEPGGGQPRAPMILRWEPRARTPTRQHLPRGGGANAVDLPLSGGGIKRGAKRLYECLTPQ